MQNDHKRDFDHLTKSERQYVPLKKKLVTLCIPFIARHLHYMRGKQPGEPKEGEQGCLYELSEPQNGKTNLYEKKGP